MKTKGLLLTAFLLASGSCNKDDSNGTGINYRHEMRSFVEDISSYAKSIRPSFLIIPQNGIELVSENGEPGGTPVSAYLSAIDGCGQEDLFFGYNSDDVATPASETDWIRSFLDIAKNAGKTILVTDYCSTPALVDQSYAHNAAAGYKSFAAPQRQLNLIPSYPSPITGENDAVIVSPGDVKNFLYLINPENYLKKSMFIYAVTATNYDLLIVDLFFNAESIFTASEVEELRAKANGGRRLVIAYMSVGEAENYRWYWQSGWNPGSPAWLGAENPDWPGNFTVKYWDPEWQKIIYGNDGSYLKKILDAGFDGVYLDRIDAFEYYER
jgi:cysteinyl-tRNA synthetase, unknown class